MFIKELEHLLDPKTWRKNHDWLIPPDFYGRDSLTWVDTDVTEDEEAYRIDADLPGVSEDDITITVSEDILNIKGARNSEKRAKLTPKEQRYLKLNRDFKLPEDADQAKIKATLTHGVLNVLIPKLKKPDPKIIPITTKKTPKSEPP
tara:strand:+ start:147 stop:587 length:441 start_codon:yes stop_codon:yes gene_type:complete